MSYLVLKWLHVLSSTVLFGTGIGSAWYMLLASLTRDARVAATVVGHVVVADALFTTTAILVQPATGLAMAHMAQIPISTPWIFWSFVLYFVAGACWLPVVWIQLQMRNLAREAAAANTALPPRYWRFLKVWVLLGIPAFAGLVGVFWLMVAKPQ